MQSGCSGGQVGVGTVVDGVSDVVGVDEPVVVVFVVVLDVVKSVVVVPVVVVFVVAVFVVVVTAVVGGTLGDVLGGGGVAPPVGGGLGGVYGFGGTVGVRSGIAGVGTFANPEISAGCRSHSTRRYIPVPSLKRMTRVCFMAGWRLNFVSLGIFWIFLPSVLMPSES